MTEQEIVNILKENKNKGVADLFLPGEVSDWIAENLNNSNLLYLDSMGNWAYSKDADFDDYDNVVFALPDMFDLPPKIQSGWVEFDINERGQFLVIFTQNLRYYFNWFEWWRLLEKSIDYNYGFTAFGGWQYPNSQYWFTTPEFRVGEIGYVSAWDSTKQEPKPAIPIKIRFWRESR